MVCNHSKPILSEWAANPGCRSDIQHRGGSEAGFNTVELDGPNPSPTPTPSPSARLALLISLERYATPLPFFSLWPQRGADGAAPSKGYSRLELASCRLSRPSGRAKFLKLTGLAVDSVHSDPKSKSFATRRIFLQAARDHEDDHHTHPKKLDLDFD